MITILSKMLEREKVRNYLHALQFIVIIITLHHICSQSEELEFNIFTL